MKDEVIARHALLGCSEPHGLLIDSEHRLAFVVCEENPKLAFFDLESKSMTAIHSVGPDPDVLAFDKSFARLYAHSVAVDSRTHRVFFPLQNVGGKPTLRIALPSDKQL
jgi:DNA-binding beta-propeller fold protein YncE